MFCGNVTSDVSSSNLRETNAVGLALYRLYTYAGIPAVVANLICLVIFVSTQELRRKYVLFIALTIGDLSIGLGMLLAGIFRTRLILNNDYNKRTSFECLRNPWPHFYIIGGQISACIMLIMGIERILAVHKPLFYKKYVTFRLRLAVISQCFVLAVISLLIGYLCSYLNSDQCVMATCSTLNTTGRSYSDYNYIVIIGFPIVALVLNIFTYFGAKRSSANAQIQREWGRVLLTLAICTCSVILIAVPNFILWGYVRYWNPVFMPYLFIAFCCYSTVNLFVYIIIKGDFRRQFLRLISFGRLNPKIDNLGHRKSDIRMIQIQPNEPATANQPIPSNLTNSTNSRVEEIN